MPAIRIIAGKYKGRKIPVLEKVGLRPTGNRVRETLFNWLMNDIQGASCLDLFSGTGALGLEALSRGAKSSLFVEKDKQSILQLKKIIAAWGCENAKVYGQDALKFLEGSSQKADIVFLDPPFDANCWDLCLQKLAEKGWLHPETLIYIESSSRWHWNEKNFTCIKSKKSGDVHSGLFLSKSKK